MYNVHHSMDIINLYISSWVYIYINGNTSNLDSWDGQWIHSYLVGGFKHFLFSIIYGITLPIDFHIFQDGWNHQPVIYIYIYGYVLYYCHIPMSRGYYHICILHAMVWTSEYIVIDPYISIIHWIYIYTLMDSVWILNISVLLYIWCIS